MKGGTLGGPTWLGVVPDVERLHEQQLAGGRREAAQRSQRQALSRSVKDGPVGGRAGCQDQRYLAVRRPWEQRAAVLMPDAGSLSNSV